MNASSPTNFSSSLLASSCRYLSALSSCYAAQGLQLIAFERYLSLRKSSAGGNHAHLNVIGVPAAAAAGAQAAFTEALSAAGLGDFEVLEAGAGAGASAVQCMLRGALGAGGAGGSVSEYFQAILPGGVRLVRAIARGERWPMSLGREVLAGLAGVPERADWKACKVADGKEAEASEAFKAMFKEYDPTATGGDS